MIKEILTSTLLTSAILNTTIVNNIQRIVYMNNTSYWTNDIYNEPNETPYIYSYRTISTTDQIINDSFTLKQRAIEKYINKPEDQIITNEYYLLAYYETNSIADLKKIQISINSQLVQLYQFTNGTYSYGYDEIPLSNSTLINFLNNTEYTTRQQYDAVISAINTVYPDEYQQETTTLTEQNYANVCNNVSIYYQQEEAPQYYWSYIIKIKFEYNSSAMPVDQPYSPCGNYAKTIKYQNIQFATAVNSGGTGEIVDIPGIMFTVLGMPLAWFSTAFNFTLFPGTIYAVNISHLLLGLVVACLAIFIIKRILK